jgi:hypothetical protein
MTISRCARFLISAIVCGFLLSGCAKTEPDIPTFDPLDKVQQSEGWKVGPAVAVSPGTETPMAHHVQTIASGLHNIDFDTPPTALIPVEPSCKVTKPSTNSGKYLIIGDGSANFSLMKKPKVRSLLTVTQKKASHLAKAQVETTLVNQTRSNEVTGRVPLPASSMAIKDVFITQTSEPVAVALTGGGLFNFNLAPGVRLTGVVVYVGETAYNKTDQAAVAGVPAGVPVNFVSEKHPASKECWTRVQARPDKSWPKRLQGGRRYKALLPHWKTFYRKVRKDIGDVPQKNVISVSYSGHYLIGPAPTRYEDRIPYVAFAGKTVHYMEAEHVNFGTREENNAFARQILDQYYEAQLKAARK